MVNVRRNIINCVIYIIYSKNIKNIIICNNFINDIEYQKTCDMSYRLIYFIGKCIVLLRERGVGACLGAASGRGVALTSLIARTSIMSYLYLISCM